MNLVRRPNFSNVLIYLMMNGGMVTCFFVKPELGAIAIAILLYFLTAGLGWSVGIHRGLIHRSFKTYRWVENGLAILGTLSGLGSPLSSSRIHFVRDYCQSNTGITGAELPESFWQSYIRSPFFYDSWLEPAPVDLISMRIKQRPFFCWLENRWVLLGLMAAILYGLGGPAYLAWGLFARYAVSAHLFACFDYFCHSPSWGRQRFQIVGASSEGRNHWIVGLITMGEGWHNNHHAMPASPRMGIGRFEFDLGYVMIRCLQSVGLAWDLVAPENALKSNASIIEIEQPPITNTDQRIHSGQGGKLIKPPQ